MIAAAVNADERWAVKANVAAIFGGFRAMRQQGEEAEATTEITLTALREFQLGPSLRLASASPRDGPGLIAVLRRTTAKFTMWFAAS